MKIVRTLLLVLCLLCAVTFGTLVRSRSLDKGFDQIRPGDTAQHVIDLRGNPRYVKRCSPSIEQANCAQELVYAHPLAPLVPEYWLVALDASGHVLQTAHSTTY